MDYYESGTSLTARSLAAFSRTSLLREDCHCLKFNAIKFDQTHRRPMMYTVAPLLSSAVAIIKPIPLPPPVTTATKPARITAISRAIENPGSVLRTFGGK